MSVPAHGKQAATGSFEIEAVVALVHVACPNCPSPPGYFPKEKNVCICVPVVRTTSTSPSPLTSIRVMLVPSWPKLIVGLCDEAVVTARPTQFQPPAACCGV